MTKLCDNCENKVTEEIREPESFAMELLKDYSKQAKRWFIIAVVELAMIVAIIAGGLYFLLTSEISYTELSTEGGGNANYLENSTINDINN